MGFFRPTPPPYDPLIWVKKPFAERARMVCDAWAMQGYGAPLGALLFYALKVGFYVGGWLFFCSLSPGLGGPSSVATWWLRPLAFEKAIVWSMLFESLGLGCGSGPLTARYLPPIGGALYFLWPGTTKLPLVPGLPLLGGRQRGPVDVALYLSVVGFAVHALASPEPSFTDFVGLAALVPLLGIADKTVFLAARAEHYWVTIVCFAFAGNWIAGAKAVELALWFWAGFSKLNHHFPTVICVMTSNGPFTRFSWLRRRMYRSYPDDLRPSRLATILAHAGASLEFGVPLAFVLTPLGTPPVVAVVLMLLLHGYITSNVPMGVPIEWNVMVVYGGMALFWAHPDVSLTAVGSAPVALFLVVMLVALPLLGNLFPSRLSFLMAMRYYAGNWACSVWLFRGESYRKLDRLTKASPWVHDQLGRFYDRSTAVGLVGKVMGFRMMHLHGRAFSALVPKAVARFEDYEWVDGELVAGMALGWNFGEGHLHHEQLLTSIQAQCGFEEGELRCIFLEAQPLGRSTLAYRIADAKTGAVDRGVVDVADLRARQPWEVPA
ncbi:MAG TPA: DUF3556 domain-containing protein [Polyangiaceae bacterium]|nr:DUF3556 domain-containing protein [Polyangiaceae bacterium]